MGYNDGEENQVETSQVAKSCEIRQGKCADSWGKWVVSIFPNDLDRDFLSTWKYTNVT